MSSEKKEAYLHAIANYHAAMIGLSTEFGPQSYRQQVEETYGFEFTCYLVDGEETPSRALDIALQ